MDKQVVEKHTMTGITKYTMENIFDYIQKVNKDGSISCNSFCIISGCWFLTPCKHVCDVKRIFIFPHHKEREIVLTFSAMGIYNESVRDLLSLDGSHLRLLDDPERGTIVEKLT
ncbi:hypothetical protein Dimus_003420 [Dionaea muscipula]